MKKDKKLVRIIFIAAIFLVVYLVLDYINLPTLIGIKIENVNMDVFNLILNSVIVIVLYIISFIYIDNKQNLKDKNARDTAKILLQNTYKECLDTLTMLDNQVFVKDYIIPKIDGNKTDKENKVVNNLQTLPFESFDTIMSFSSNGYVEQEDIEQYLSIKKDYQFLVSLKTTFFDLGIPETEEQTVLFNEIDTRDRKIKETIDKILRKTTKE